ncbi:MAG: ABC transporter substrate-binding protein [Parcubacteria group bacterium]|nr:ABC transporter substrate-binding protein [Parcubacteria group bacterium]
MDFKRLSCILPLFFVFVVSPKVSFAGHESPTIFVKNVVDEFLGILQSEKNKDFQKEKILNLMKASFDFPSITEDLFHELKVDDKDKMAFTDTFPLLLKMRYGMFVKSSNDLSVEYKGHEFFTDGLKAIVHTRTKIPNNDVALDYKLHHVDGKWKIYDLTADGIGLVSNYRVQIHKVLTQMSFPDFLIYLKKMVSKKID